jgi:hypothetical protein
MSLPLLFLRRLKSESRAMRIWSPSVLVPVVLAAFIAQGSPIPATTKQSGTLVDEPVVEVNIQESNIHLALSKLANQYQLPIGLEVAADDDLLKDRNLAVRVKAGTVKDVLDAIATQCPDYTWELKDEVINVFPKRPNRDPLLENILAVRLKTFAIEKGTARIEFTKAVVSSHELSSLLEANGLSVEYEIFSKHDIRALGRRFSVNVSDVTVKSLLNQVIKRSETKYWLLNRYGENRQYLLLKL